jgi:asparagine synthase (glutamine-hydrolysing)
MCGIAGFLGDSDHDVEALRDRINRMCVTLRHRGPDDSGCYVEEKIGLALGHRRLSILDLSSAGHQPMRSQSGRYVMVFNGEIYNHLALRKELESGGASLSWRGHSDTETLLACIDQWGFAKSLLRLVGMFALAVWDNRDRRLFLARDRMGEKPLYYGRQGGVFLFASELAAFREHPAFEGKVDRASLASLLRENCIPGTQCVYQGLRKLAPGFFVEIPAEHVLGQEPVQTSYWKLSDAIRAGKKEPFAGSDAEAVARLNELLRQAVSGQMVADVPLGVMLSGGTDSSLVTGVMQELSGYPIRTFTIDFANTPNTEAAHARAVARHLGTDHTEMRVSGAEAMSIIPDLPSLFSEPFADSSQVPTFLVSRLARSRVTVALSGDGGDELFGGYNRYLQGMQSWSRFAQLPRVLRQTLSRALTGVSQERWDTLMAFVGHALPRRFRLASPGYKAHKLAEVLDAETVRDYYGRVTTHWRDADKVVIGASEVTSPLVEHALPSFLSPEEWMMAMDALTYLPDDILTKVDRAAMAVSLETRVPLLDHRLVEFTWTLPLHFRIREGIGKWLLRQVLYRYVPRELVERPKMGFGGPLENWLRGPLRDWAEALLDERRLRREGFFEALPIREKWDAFLKGEGNWQYHLWDVLMFQGWWEARNNK